MKKKNSYENVHCNFKTINPYITRIKCIPITNLSIYLFLAINLSIFCLLIYLSFVYQYIYILSINLSIFFLSIYLSFVHQSIFLSINLSFCLSIYLSVYQFIFLSINLSICLSFYLCISILLSISILHIN